MSDRHAVLRTSLAFSEFNEPLQIVHQSGDIPIQLEDLSHLTPAEQEREVKAWLEAEKDNHFDWDQAPLLRVQIHRRTTDTFNFTLSFHHAILDGWSVALLLNELFQRYASQLGYEVPFPRQSPAIAYRDFVALERISLESKECREYWDHRLNDVTIMKLPRWKAVSDSVEITPPSGEFLPKG